MVKQIYQSELQLNEANSSDTEASFLDLLGYEGIFKNITDRSKAVFLLWFILVVFSRPLPDYWFIMFCAVCFFSRLDRLCFFPLWCLGMYM